MLGFIYGLYVDNRNCTLSPVFGLRSDRYFSESEKAINVLTGNYEEKMATILALSNAGVRSLV